MKQSVYYIILSLVFLGSCKKEKFDIHNLNGDRIYVLGHGGMGYSNLYPINSMPSLIGCLNTGADGSEMDVQLTKDSVLVLFHDHDLSLSTTLSGTIQNMNWADVQKAYYTNVPYGNYPVVRLADFLNTNKNYPNQQFSLDIKLYSGDTELHQYFNVFAEELTQLFNTYQLFSNARIESQSVEFLNILKEKSNAFQLYFYPQSFEEGYSTALANGYKGISISTDIISTEQVKQAHDSGLFVTLWGTSTKKKNEEAIRKNPDMIETDKVEDLVKLLD